MKNEPRSSGFAIRWFEIAGRLQICRSENEELV